MNRRSNERRPHSKLIVLALLGVACGPPKLIGGVPQSESEGEGESTESTTDEQPSNPSTSGNANDSTSETDTGDADTSQTFVPPYDAWGCECDPFVQDCAAGNKCVPYASTGEAWDSNKCVPVTGEQLTGEPCTYGGVFEATDDCDATGICLDRDGDTLGTCVAFCSGVADNPECPDSQLCEVSNEGSAPLCMDQCTALLQDCEAPTACYWDVSGFHCIPGGEVPIGEPCEVANDCPPGNQCVEGSLLPSCAGEACCTGFCEVGLEENLCLIPGTACVPFFEEGAAPVGLEQVGLCLSP